MIGSDTATLCMGSGIEIMCCDVQSVTVSCGEEDTCRDFPKQPYLEVRYPLVPPSLVQRAGNSSHVVAP